MAYKKGSVFEAVYKEKMTGDSSGVDALIQQHQQEGRKKRAENAQTVSTSGGVPPYDRTEAGIAADGKNDILRTAYEGQGRKTLFPSVPAKKETKPSYSEAQSKLDKAKKIAQQIETWNGSKFGVDAMDKVYDDQIKDLLSENGYQSYDDLQNAIDGLGKDAYRLKNEERYGNLEKNADFAEKSQAVPDKKTSGIGIALGTSWLGAGDAKFDYINDIDGYRKKFAGSDKQGNSPYAIYDYMDPGEAAKYNYIHNTQGEKAANEYLDYLKYDLDARKTRDVAAGYGQYATEHPVAASAASVPANLMGGIGYLSAAGQYVGNKFREGLTGEYRPVNYNTGAMYPTVAATTIRGTVSENIADSTGRIQLDEGKHPILSRVLNGKSLGDVYQMGMSMADSAAVALLTPVIGNGGLALLGGSAATQGMMDALDRGATDGQAITMGMLNGAFETIFEKVSLENLLQNYSKTTLQAIFSQMLAEGSEEFNTSLANDAADLLVMAGKSDYRQNIEKYRQKGLDEEAATKYALWDKAVSLAWDAIGGAVSGGIMGAVSAPIERRFQNVQSGGNAQVQQEAPAAAPEQQTQMAVPDQQMPLKTPEQQTNEAIQKALNMNKAEEAVAPQVNALDEALAKFSETGKVSNNTAEKVLGDPEAVRQLIEKTGAELGYTASQKRNAVKQAIADIFSGTNKTEQNATEQATAQETAYRDEAVPQAAENSGAIQGTTQEAETERQEARTQAENVQSAGETGVPANYAIDGNATEKNGTGSAENVQETEMTAEAVKDGNRNSGTISQQNVPSGDAAQTEHGSVGAANQNFTGTAAYDDLLTDENVQPPRSSDAKNVEVPKVDAYGRNVSEFAQNTMNSDIISERDVDTAKRLISEGVFGHEVQRMDDVRERVYKEIQNKGLSDSVWEVSRAAASGELSEYDIAKAEVLFAMLTNKKGTRAENMAGDLLVDLSEMATQSGRQLNMFKLLRRLTPVGQLSAVKTNMKRYVDNLNKSRSGKKKVSVEIPEELEKAYIDAATSGDEGKQREALDQIYKCAASQFPSTLEEKFNALRHMAMLGNPMTHIRNFGATGAFRPMASIKRTISAAIQSVTLDQKNRTAAVIGVGKEGRALLNWATADAKSDTARSMMKGTYQNGDNARNTIEDYRTIFKTKWLEGTRQVIGNALEAEDMVWKKREYALTLASFLKARGYTAQQAQSGVIPESVMTEGRQLAVQEALKSTFNDRNRFSDLMSKFRKKGNTATDKALNIMAEGILPYTRTPANIAVRGVEYSPAGLAKSFADLATGIKSGKITAAQGIDNLAAGLTGTGIMILGAGLAAGLVPGVRLVGELPEDDEPEENTQKNAIEIGGKSFGIGWIAPTAIPLFIGANLYNRMKSVGKDGDVDAWDVISSIVGAMKSGLDPILELSCMSGINDAIDDMKYEETGGDKAVSFVYHVATGYFLQAIPTVFGQIEKAVEPNKKKTFTNGETDVQRIVERTIGSTFRKLPGDPYQIDKVDAYGNVVKESDNPLVRVANAFVNPFTVQDIDRSAVTKEIKRLNGVQPDSVNIPSVPKTISYTDTDGNTHDDQRLTAEQYSTLEKVQKQTASKILNEVIGTDIYKAMTDEQKADVFGYVYDYAREKGRSEAIKGYPGITDAWMKDVEKNGYGAIAGKVISKGFADAFESMEADDLDSAYKLYKSLSFINREKFKRENGGRTGYLITAKENGVSTKAFTSLYSAYKSLDNNTSMEIKEKAQEWSVALEKAYDSGQITKAGRDALKDEMKFYYQTPANKAKFDAMTESGVSTYDADRIIKGLNALAGTGSVNKDTGEKTVTDADKWEYISEVDGISDSERDMLMKLYMPDYDPTAKNPVKTELKYDYLRDQGYSAEEYVETYRVTQQYSKKAERINAWKALGYSDAEARMLYKLYTGKIDLTG